MSKKYLLKERILEPLNEQQLYGLLLSVLKTNGPTTLDKGVMQECEDLALYLEYGDNDSIILSAGEYNES